VNALCALSDAIDRFNERVGRAVAWLTLAMVLVTFLVVILRYVFSVGFVWLQESYVWMHGVVFMLGAGYTLLHDGHVRVDLLYAGASARRRAWVNLGGVLALLLPLVLTIWWGVWPYVIASWERLESSREAGGLPGLFLLKSVLLGFCIVVGLQGVSLALRSVIVLAGDKDPSDDQPTPVLESG